MCYVHNILTDHILLQAFMPMAKVAKKIVKENGFENVITVVPKSSMDMSVPRGIRMLK